MARRARTLIQKAHDCLIGHNLLGPAQAERVANGPARDVWVSANTVAPWLRPAPRPLEQVAPLVACARLERVAAGRSAFGYRRDDFGNGAPVQPRGTKAHREGANMTSSRLERCAGSVRPPGRRSGASGSPCTHVTVVGATSLARCLRHHAGAAQRLHGRGLGQLLRLSTAWPARSRLRRLALAATPAPLPHSRSASTSRTVPPSTPLATCGSSTTTGARWSSMPAMLSPVGRKPRRGPSRLIALAA